jgi:hypothetical protein
VQTESGRRTNATVFTAFGVKYGTTTVFIELDRINRTCKCVYMVVNFKMMYYVKKKLKNKKQKKTNKTKQQQQKKRTPSFYMHYI